MGITKQRYQNEIWRQLDGSNELGNGRQGWPIRESLLSRLFPSLRTISVPHSDTLLNWKYFLSVRPSEKSRPELNFVKRS